MKDHSHFKQWALILKHFDSGSCISLTSFRESSSDQWVFINGQITETIIALTRQWDMKDETHRHERQWAMKEHTMSKHKTQWHERQWAMTQHQRALCKEHWLNKEWSKSQRAMTTSKSIELRHWLNKEWAKTKSIMQRAMTQQRMSIALRQWLNKEWVKNQRAMTQHQRALTHETTHNIQWSMFRHNEPRYALD